MTSRPVFRPVLLPAGLAVLSTSPFASADLITVGSSIKSSARDRAAALLRKRDIVAARKIVQQTTAADPNSPHPEIVLADLLLQVGNPKLGVSLLEAVATREPERFDVRFAFCSVALRQRRWFDCWTHIRSCEQSPMPSSWSPLHRKVARQELKTLKARCCEGREDWKTAKAL